MHCTSAMLFLPSSSRSFCSAVPALPLPLSPPSLAHRPWLTWTLAPRQVTMRAIVGAPKSSPMGACPSASRTFRRRPLASPCARLMRRQTAWWLAARKGGVDMATIESILPNPKDRRAFFQAFWRVIIARHTKATGKKPGPAHGVSSSIIEDAAKMYASGLRRGRTPQAEQWAENKAALAAARQTALPSPCPVFACRKDLAHKGKHGGCPDH